jgi:hypothetical protein
VTPPAAAPNVQAEHGPASLARAPQNGTSARLLDPEIGDGPAQRLDVGVSKGSRTPAETGSTAQIRGRAKHRPADEASYGVRVATRLRLTTKSRAPAAIPMQCQNS